ncbi:ferritin-like domain-containing protein [Aminipila butyrica]|uniref:Ferritin-like domain-containing protein n=1 Tax=Aminipila butyrica TaxID=433296 RepID=A0A858BVL9_9FIRM|nr:ferritin-like domain-containing protein [Aminipila butyrica]QIB69148.1 ferritin-like domain-containing protein [Aminipila butyrica]
MTLLETLQTYMNESVADSAYYRQLAEMAPDQTSRDLLQDMAANEMQQAEEFGVIYQGMTGDVYTPRITTSLQRHSYREGLQNQSLAEGYRYRNYMGSYNRNRGLGDALLLGSLFSAGVNKNLNSLALLYLLSRV